MSFKANYIHKLNTPKCINIAYVLVACLSLFLMGVFHTPINDDLSYRYVFYSDSSFLEGDGDLIIADTFGKIIDSQIFHYFYVNGRAIVHIIIQIFAGILGNKFYTIFSPFLLALILILFVRYTCPTTYRKNPVIWAFPCIAWMYLYPSPIGLFHWLAYGMNYLYPMCLTLVFLIYFRHICNSSVNYHIIKLILIAVLGFFTGWSQEGFALPLSGGMFTYVIINWRKITKPVIFLIAGLWIGTIIMTISPGNFIRMSEYPLLTKIKYSIHEYFYLRGFIISWIIILAAWIINRQQFKTTMRKYAHVWFCLIFALLFGLIARTGSWSLISVEFYAFIIVATLIPTFLGNTHSSTKGINITASIILILIVAHQSVIISTTARLQQQEKEFIERSKYSVDGITPYPDTQIPTIAAPWVYDYTKPYFLAYELCSFAVLNGRRDVPIFMISEKDYDAIFNPDKFFISENKIPGSANFYDGEDYYWIKTSDYSENDTYTLHYAPPKLSESPYLLLFFKILLTPNSPGFVKSEVLDIDAKRVKIPGDHNDAIAIRKTTWRTVTNVTRDR